MPEAYLNSVKISHMPDQFRLAVSGRKIPFLFIVLGVLVLLIGVLAGLFLYKKSQIGLNNPVANNNIVKEVTPKDTAPVAPAPVSQDSAPSSPIGPLNSFNGPNVAPPPQSPPPVAKPATPQSTQDSDRDGLTDIEDDLYGTDSRKSDFDADGHLDGPELVNLYDPSKPSPAMLDASSLVKLATNDNWAYSVDYPAKWLARPVDSDQREYMFTSNLGEFIEVIIQENTDKLPLADWYARQAPGVNASQVESFTTKRGMKGVKSLDGLTVYMIPDAPEAGRFVYTITYNAGTAAAYNFLSTWQMMINSFRVSKVLTSRTAATPQSSQSQPASPAPASSAEVPASSGATIIGPTSPPSQSGPQAPPTTSSTNSSGTSGSTAPATKADVGG